MNDREPTAVSRLNDAVGGLIWGAIILVLLALFGAGLSLAVGVLVRTEILGHDPAQVRDAGETALYGLPVVLVPLCLYGLAYAVARRIDRAKEKPVCDEWSDFQ